jgi:hypothetical protein
MFDTEPVTEQEHEAALVEWNTILIELTPQGLLPRPGTPRRLVLNAVADEMKHRRLFEPAAYRPAWLTDAVVVDRQQAAERDYAIERDDVAPDDAGRLIAPISDATTEFWIVCPCGLSWNGTAESNWGLPTMERSCTTTRIADCRCTWTVVRSRNSTC